MLDFKIPAVKHIVFSTNLDIRIHDINYGNHLGNDSLISLLHEARVRLLKSKQYTELDIDGLGILITSLAVKYLNEAFYSEKLIVNIEIGDFSKTSVELIYQVITQQTEKEIARALTTMTFYDYEKAKVAAIPQEFLRSFGLKNSD